MRIFTQRSRRLALAAALPVFLVSFAACDDDNADTSTAQLRVVHLSPDAPAVDVWGNGSLRAVSSLGFAEGTGYLTLDTGIYDFAVAAAGTSADDSVLDVSRVELEREKKYTVVAFDNLASIDALLLEDDDSELAPGNIRIRAIHAAAAVGEVDIWNIPDMGAPSALYENVGFGVAGGYLDLPAGAYTIGFDVDNDASPDLTFDIPSLPAGTVANVFAVSDSGGAVFLLAQFADGTTARIDPN